MATRVDSHPEGTLIITTGGNLYIVTVNGTTITGYSDEKAANEFARWLDRARTSNKRAAMQILCERLFFSEQYAEHLYFELFREQSSVEVNRTVN